MRAVARFPFPLAVAAGLCLAVGGSAALAGSAPLNPVIAPEPASPGAAVSATSTTPTLGEALGPSNPAQVSLAEHLRTRGVIFYGAFWCQHCFRQKVLFGQEAGNRLPYVECAKDEAGAKACEAAGVNAYPTWVMGKERLVGVQSLKELAVWSQYTGPLDFGSDRLGS